MPVQGGRVEAQKPEKRAQACEDKRFTGSQEPARGGLPDAIFVGGGFHDLLGLTHQTG